MAVLSVCGKLFNGWDAGCEAGPRKFYQQACIINKDDIDPATITKTLPDLTQDPPTCNYNVAFELKDGKKGYKFVGPEAGNSFYGSFDKSRSDLGYTQYIHNTQVLINGVSEESQCILGALDKGSFVVALQLTDGTVVIYGLDNGLQTGDYTYNISEGGGGVPVLLSSSENAPESYLPYIYKSGTAGQEGTDFDACFENPPGP